MLEKMIYTSKPKGFTLVELIVTVAVLAIIASVAIPAYQGLIQKQRLVAAAEAARSHLLFAKSEAIKTGSPSQLFIRISTGSSPWCLGISSSNATCDCNLDGSCTFGLVSTERNLSGSEFSGISASSSLTHLEIDSIRGGMNAVTGQEITLTSTGGEQLSIDVDTLGQVRICRPGDFGKFDPC